MIDTYIKRKNLRLIVYILGAIVELVGLIFLFNFEKATDIITKYPLIFSLFLVIAGFTMAVSGRRIK